jgi:broad specificity phosphatase PhoE
MRLRAGPPSIWLVRHGQSEGNVARDSAEAEGLPRVELAGRDADVELSDLGRQQAEAFGSWLGEQPRDEWPTAVVCSTYTRARQTAEVLLRAAGLDLEVELDERLRDREMGRWDSLTWRGITELHPEEAEQAVRLGRYYHRPFGGESWADITLRLRTLLADVARDLAQERVLLVTHDVPIQLVRALVEGLDEQATVDLVRGAAYANCALTVFDRGPEGYQLARYNHTVPVEKQGVEPTEETDVPAGT